jgi:ABC-type branched-subunit amino acid transport system substrate-binding protein
MNNAVQNYLKGQLQKSGIDLVTETYEIGSKDFRQQLVKLSSKRPQVVRILDFGDKLPVVLKQVSETGTFKDATVVTGIEILDAPYSKFTKDITDRLVFTTPKVLMDENNAIVRAYEKKYGSPPGYDAMFCYDTVNLLVPIIRKHGYDNVDKVIDEISKMKRYKGVAAEYSVNKYGGISPDIYWAKVEKGKIVFTNP